MFCICLCLCFWCVFHGQVQPIDLIKTRIQVVGKAQNIGAVTITKNLIKNEGFMKLYAGLSASLMRQAIYGTARLGLHRMFSNYLKDRNNGHLTFWMSAGSSLTAGALAGIIGNPFDIAMVRMQADGLRPVEERRGYKNCFVALYRITREEGLMTLWRGCLPMIFRAMSMNFGMLASYDLSKQFFDEKLGKGLGANLMASAVSGFCCAFTSLPFDLMKTRLMNMSPDPVTKEMPYKNLWDCFVKIFKKEGVFAYWRGFWTYYLRCAPHAMIILLVNEAVIPGYERLFFGGRVKSNCRVC